MPVINAPTVSATGRVALTWSAVPVPTGTTLSYRVTITNVVTGVVSTVNVGGAAYNFRPTLLSLQQGLSFSVQAVATAIRVANPTVFGTTVGTPSNTVSFKAVQPAVPAVPTGLAATINGATGAVTLNWTAVTPAAGTTITYLAIIDGAAPVAITRGAALALAVGTTHTVQVATVATSQGLSSTSAYTTPLTIDLTAAAVPNAPATLTVTATTLTWTAPAALAGTGSTNVTYTYNVQKSVDGGVTWTLLTPTPITARTLAAASPVGTNYQYQVQAMATRYGLATSAAGAWKTTVFNTAPAANTTPVAALLATRRHQRDLDERVDQHHRLHHPASPGCRCMDHDRSGSGGNAERYDVFDHRYGRRGGQLHLPPVGNQPRWQHREFGGVQRSRHTVIEAAGGWKFSHRQFLYEPNEYE